MSSTESNAKESLDGVTIRTCQKKDQADIGRLYTEGLLAGQIAPNDTGADIDNNIEAYFDDERHHFWVAEHHGHVVGMIGVASDEPHTAEIRRLRVQQDHQETALAALLLETALAHCKHHGYLKVRLDTRFERSAALDLFEKVGFQHTRTVTSHGKDIIEFYLDLYRPPRPDED